MNRRDLKRLRQQVRHVYNSFPSPIWCPSLRKPVWLNSEGFHHLTTNGLGHSRSIAEEKHKLELVSFIPHILRVGKITSRRKRFQRIGRKKEAEVKPVEYWSIEAGFQGASIKLILRRVGEGKIIFWSIMRKNKKNHE